jgi:hypothetical protein
MGLVCLGCWALCMGEAQPLDYILVLLFMESIEQSFPPPNMVSAKFL